MSNRLCVGNWKMFKTTGEARAFVDAFLPVAAAIADDTGIVICPPFTALQSVGDRLRSQTRVRLGAQNMHWERSGAFTGEVSPAMLADLGVAYVILGHSERRQHFGETDEGVRLKTAAALANGIIPVVAVGETLATRTQGLACEFVVKQTRAALFGLDASSVRRVVIAYEPVWAIGTGENCAPADANAIMHAIRESTEGLDRVSLLYGGSVKPENIASYMAQPEIGGALVGGASLDAAGFALLVKAAGA